MRRVQRRSIDAATLDLILDWRHRLALISLVKARKWLVKQSLVQSGVFRLTLVLELVIGRVERAVFCSMALFRLLQTEIAAR